MFTGIETFSQHTRRRRGFSFTEIMFAVVILGIGFIMVAAVFPVALQQSKSTAEEINAAGIARGATNFAGQIFSDDAVPNPNPPTANPYPGRSNLQASGTAALPNRPVVSHMPIELNPVTTGQLGAWDLLRGNLLMTEDPRYAYVMLYRRDGDIARRETWAPYAQIYIIPVQVRNKNAFTAADTLAVTTGANWSTVNPTANLMAHPVRVAIDDDVDDAGGVDIIAFDTSPVGTLKYLSDNVGAAAEGAYVVIANDNIATPNTAPNDSRGKMNGTIYKLGVRRTDLEDSIANPTIIPTMPTREIYELAPGNDFSVDAGGDGLLGPNPMAGNKSDDILKVGIPIPASADHIGITLQGGTAWADAFVVGRSYVDPADPTLGFEGPAMPISAFTTFVKVK